MTSYKTKYPNIYRQFSQRSSLFIDYPDRLNCTLCHNIMIEPIQNQCGCRYCFQCIERYINGSNVQCPLCKEIYLEKDKLLGDKAIEREIMNLGMKCVNVGCGRILLLKNLDAHLVECEHRMEQCDECKDSYLYTDRQSHVTDKCIKSVLSCGDCGESMTRERLTKVHRNYNGSIENICKMWIRDCPFKCNLEKLVNVRIHLKICPNKPLECPFKEIGCRVTGTSLELTCHKEKDRIAHENFMMAQIINLKNENTKLQRRIAEQEENSKLRIKQLEEMVDITSKTVPQLTQSIEPNNLVGSSVLSSKLSPDENGKNISICNGIVTWTIPDFRGIIEANQTRSNSYFISDAFYISRPGYNISLKIYPSGDGGAYRQYLSVYFMIKTGDYDDEISWPFQCKMRLTLHSSDPTRGDISVNMKPDTNPACYGRPFGIPNVGAGQPAFVRISEIISGDHFLHNGALKIALSIL